MTAIEVIRAKRDGRALTDRQIGWVIDAYSKGHVGDEQMAALAMAIVLRGMTPREVASWTNAMLNSGERMNLTALARPTVDKHSTGGVGDKITLPLTPLVAACGAAVPQLSGRGLGHTGGTLDKLEAIPGWRAHLTHSEYLNQLRDVGAVICAATDTLAAADRKLYALRDVTGTVESIPLIASSIMSKKLAEGAAALVLDVKVGSGAFMIDVSRARELANLMVGIGADAGVQTSAMLTRMDTPLGNTVGNALEVAEAVEVLGGGGPPDVVELTLALANQMLNAAGLPDSDPAQMLANGAAMDVWRAMIRAQGGDPSAPLPRATEQESVRATQDGYLTTMDARAIGMAAWALGAGRARQQDLIDVSAGAVLHRKPGDRVSAGQPLLDLHTSDASRIPAALVHLQDAFVIAAEPAPKTTLIVETIEAPEPNGSG